MNWAGRTIEHSQYGTGRVITDLAHGSFVAGRMLVIFRSGVRRWVDGRNCELAR